MTSQRYVSGSAERSWIIIHTSQGPYHLCIWYRPPRNAFASVTSFEQEHCLLNSDVLGTILIGDLNLHNRPWLRHSQSTMNAAGRDMQDVAYSYGFELLRQEPMRGHRLLDVALSDIPGAKAKVLSRIADHSLALASFRLAVPQATAFQRQCVDF